MAETETTPKRNLTYRRITIAEMTVSTDSRGRDFANMRVDTVAKSGPQANKTIRIFAQVFGPAYEALKAKLVVGNDLTVYGVHDRLKADEAKGIAGCSSYVIYGERKPKVVEAPVEAVAA